jgi:homoserine dehydrogenase
MMSEDGVSYEEALSMARAHGYAEPDPTMDVTGMDTACKILLIANAAMGCRKKLSDVKVTGITHITPRDVASWAMEQRTLKMIGRAWIEDDDVKIEVSPMAVPYYDIFAKVNGSGKAVRFVTDLFGEMVITVQEGGPIAASGSAFKDVLNIFRELQGRL